MEGFDVNFEIQTNNKGCSIHGSLFGITAKVRGELEPIFSNLTATESRGFKKVLKRNATTYEKVYLCSKKEVMCTLKQKKNYVICNWSGMNMRNTRKTQTT